MTLKGDGGGPTFWSPIHPRIAPTPSNNPTSGAPHSYKTGAMIGNNYGAEDFISCFLKGDRKWGRNPHLSN